MRIRLTRFISILLTMLMLLQVPLFALSEGQEKPKEITNALSYLAGTVNGRWTAVAENAAGNIPEKTVAVNALQQAKDNLKAYTSVTDIAHDVLNLSACGYDVNNLDGTDLIAKLCGYEGMLLQGANGPIYSLIALDSRNYAIPESAKWSRKALCNSILSFQKGDGGFSLNGNMDSDVDITAYALIALSPYSNDSNISNAINKAVQWLSNHQNDDGSFSSLGESCSESTATVITALISLGIPVNSDLFTKDGVSAYQALLTFQNGDGGFKHIKDGPSDTLATEQAVMALSAVCFGKSPFKLATVAPPDQKFSNPVLIVLIGIASLALIGLAVILIYTIVRRNRLKKAGFQV